jgi:hypothetical protein
MVEDLKQRLQNRYLCHCDTSVPLMLVASTVARLIVARTWLKVHYPLSRMETLDASMRDQLFLTSIEVLELSSLLLTHPPISKWAWHSQTHIQWHAVAFVLSEICSRPSSHDCDRAWEHVTAVYDRWARKEKEKKGIMWRPIKSLMAKAKYVREMQKLGTRTHTRILGGGTSSAVGERSRSTSMALPASTPAYSPTAPMGWNVNMADLENMLGVDALFPPVDLYSDSLGTSGAPSGMDLESMALPMQQLPDDLLADMVSQVPATGGVSQGRGVNIWGGGAQPKDGLYSSGDLDLF